MIAHTMKTELLTIHHFINYGECYHATSSLHKLTNEALSDLLYLYVPSLIIAVKL